MRRNKYRKEKPSVDESAEECEFEIETTKHFREEIPGIVNHWCSPAIPRIA
jgi:hypothetical protein